MLGEENFQLSEKLETPETDNARARLEAVLGKKAIDYLNKDLGAKIYVFPGFEDPLEPFAMLAEFDSHIIALDHDIENNVLYADISTKEDFIRTLTSEDPDLVEKEPVSQVAVGKFDTFLARIDTPFGKVEKLG